MNFIFAKLFERYKKKNESPVFSTTLYISFVYLCALMGFVISLFSVLTISLKENFTKETVIGGVLVAAIAINVGVYYLFFKKQLMNRLQVKYRNRKIGNALLYTLVVLMPLFFFLLGPFVTIHLKARFFN